MDTNDLKPHIQAIPIPSEISQRSQLGIQQVILEKQAIGRRKSKQTRRRAAVIAAAVGFLLVSAVFMNHTKVWASIQQALQFIPGIGIVKEDSSSVSYVMKKPISLNVGAGSIIITGMMSDEEMTYITMTGKDTPKFDSITLVNEQGVQYKIDRSMSSWSLDDWTASFWHKGKLDVGTSVKLLIGLDPAIEVPVHLDQAEAFASYPDMGETATVNGISITAIADRVGEKARVALVARHKKDFNIMDYGIHGVYMHDESQKLNVTDDSGKEMGIEHIQGVSSPASEFYFPLSNKVMSGYTLTLPEISATYLDEVKIKVSTEAKEHLNQTFELAGFPVTITRTEKVANSGLRLYLDFHYNEQAPSSLYRFGIEGLSNTAKLAEQSGVMEYVEFPVEPGSKHVQLKLVRPEVVVRGPWKFDLPVENLRAGD